MHGVVVPADHRLLVVTSAVRRKADGDDLNSRLDETAGEQALLPAEVQAVSLADRRLFARKIERSRGLAAGKKFYGLLTEPVDGSKLFECRGLALAKPVQTAKHLLTVMEPDRTADGLQVLNDKTRLRRITCDLEWSVKWPQKRWPSSVYPFAEVNVTRQCVAAGTCSQPSTRSAHSLGQTWIGRCAEADVRIVYAASHAADDGSQIGISGLAPFGFSVPSGEHIV